MAGPAQKLAKDIEGDTPEQVAWGILEWIRMVEDVRNRSGILDAYRDSLNAARAGVAAAPEVAQSASGTQRRLAYKLACVVAEMEGRDPGQRNQGDRNWILETYAECLEAVMGRRRVSVPAASVEEAVVPQE